MPETIMPPPLAALRQQFDAEIRTLSAKLNNAHDVYFDAKSEIEDMLWGLQEKYAAEVAAQMGMGPGAVVVPGKPLNFHAGVVENPRLRVNRVSMGLDPDRVMLECSIMTKAKKWSARTYYVTSNEVEVEAP